MLIKSRIKDKSTNKYDKNFKEIIVDTIFKGVPVDFIHKVLGIKKDTILKWYRQKLESEIFKNKNKRDILMEKSLSKFLKG